MPSFMIARVSLLVENACLFAYLHLMVANFQILPCFLPPSHIYQSFKTNTGFPVVAREGDDQFHLRTRTVCLQAYQFLLSMPGWSFVFCLSPSTGEGEIHRHVLRIFPSPSMWGKGAEKYEGSTSAASLLPGTKKRLITRRI